MAALRRLDINTRSLPIIPLDLERFAEGACTCMVFGKATVLRAIAGDQASEAAALSA